jgi:hypothetical protein
MPDVSSHDTLILSITTLIALATLKMVSLATDMSPSQPSLLVHDQLSYQVGKGICHPVKFYR